MSVQHNIHTAVITGTHGGITFCVLCVLACLNKLNKPLFTLGRFAKHQCSFSNALFQIYTSCGPVCPDSGATVSHSHFLVGSVVCQSAVFILLCHTVVPYLPVKQTNISLQASYHIISDD